MLKLKRQKSEVDKLVQAMDVTLSLTRLRANDSGEDSAEPYIWTVFFKLDADTLASKEPYVSIKPKIYTVDLPFENIHGGEEIQLDNGDFFPHGGSEKLILKPLPFVGFEGESRVGLVTVVLERDSSPFNAIRNGHGTLRNAIFDVLERFSQNAMATGHPPTQEDIDGVKAEVRQRVENSIKDSLTGLTETLTDQDDFIGLMIRIWSLNELINSQQVLPFQEQWKKEGNWEIFGQVIVAPHVENPLVDIEGPTHIKLQDIDASEAQGTYRVIPFDLKPPLNISWTSNGTVDNPGSESTLIKTPERGVWWIQVDVTDSAGTHAQKRIQINIDTFHCNPHNPQC
jgi:hypothetical protein